MANEMENGNLKALNELKTAIENSHRIVVLTGAGASVPSGIPDFRSAHGLYATSFGKYPAETVISHDFFMMHPRVLRLLQKQNGLSRRKAERNARSSCTA